MKDNTRKTIKIFLCDLHLIKLAKIVKSEFFNSMNLDDVEANINTYRLEIELDSNGKIKVEDSNIWAILRLLDDDCVSSEVTGNKYLAHSKMIV